MELKWKLLMSSPRLTLKIVLIPDGEFQIRIDDHDAVEEKTVDKLYRSFHDARRGALIIASACLEDEIERQTSAGDHGEHGWRS